MKDLGSYIGSFIIGASIVMMAIWGWDLYKDYTNKPSFTEVDGTTMYESSKRKGWDLWIYSTDTPKLDYETDEVYGLSKDVCMSEGLARTRNSGSFQCGKNCYTNKVTYEGGEITNCTYRSSFSNKIEEAHTEAQEMCAELYK